jgi:prepilin-type N-terminal cleavage/methylation domain-containing protein
MPRQLEAEQGFTLIEMLVVLAILGVVIGGLTQLLVSATKSETDQANRSNAQTEARLALDELRREIHCASSLTANSASSVTVALPGYCVKTTLNGALTIPASGTFTIPVADTSSFGSGSNTISFASTTTATAVTCTGTTASSFTGCSGGDAGTYPSGATVTNTVPSTITWCVPAAGAGSAVPYYLQRFVGACGAGTGTTAVYSLVSNSIFTSRVVPAPTLTVGASGGTLGTGLYSYEVTAVMTNGTEIAGTVLSTTISSGSVNKITVGWSAYTPPAGLTLASYNVYGRDATGLRLLKNVSSVTTSYVDVGPTSLSANVTMPSATIAVASTASFNSGANIISFGASGNVTCTGVTATSFTGCSGGQTGTYLKNTVVTSVSSQRPALATLSVSLVADKTPTDATERFTLTDDMVLRNSRPI